MPIRCLLFLGALVGVFTSLCCTSRCRGQDVLLHRDARPHDAELVEWQKMEGITAAYRKGNTLWLELEPGREEVVIPRLTAGIRGFDWLMDAAKQSSAKVDVRPEPTTWKLALGNAASVGCILRLEMDAPARLLEELAPIESQADGSFFLPASSAQTLGDKLRYEPQPFKNTVGYWTDASDKAQWQIELTRPGKFNVEILQGCGAGQGGSRGQLTISNHSGEGSPQVSLEFDVEETGHFQNFRWRHLGEIGIDEAGTFRLQVSPLTIRRAALMDIRAIHLVRLP